MAALDETRVSSTGTDWGSLKLMSAAALGADEVLGRLESTAGGLSSGEAEARLAQVGPNALRSHGARPFAPEFGAIALQLGERQPQTGFQLGLRDFSLLLVRAPSAIAASSCHGLTEDRGAR
jgi:Cation transporter/ATPase, N-terminus